MVNNTASHTTPSLRRTLSASYSRNVVATSNLAELNAVVDLRRAEHLPEGYDGPVLPAKEPAEA